MVELSVVIPTWNRRDKLARAIDSALKQQDVDLEVLVCDDGSNDGTLEMVAKWPDPRVKLLTGPRGTKPAIPRNRGLAAARGEWIAFLDDDDYWLPHKSRQQLLFAQSHGLLAVSSNAYSVAESREATEFFRSGLIPQCLDFSVLAGSNFVITSSVMVHHSVFKKVEGFPEEKALTVYEDYALWLRIAALTAFFYVDVPLLCYTADSVDSIRARVGSDRQSKICVYKNWLAWAWRAQSGGRDAVTVVLRLFLVALPPRVLGWARGVRNVAKSVSGKWL